MSKKLTQRQKQTLQNLKAGRSSSDGLRGQAEFGGHERTKWSLRRLGYIEEYDDKITKTGLAALKADK